MSSAASLTRLCEGAGLRSFFRMRRVALVIGSLGPGGAERVLCTLANYWAERGAEVRVLTLDEGSTAPFYRLDGRVCLLVLGIAGHSPTPFHAVWNNLKRIRRLRRVLREIAPNLVISFIDRTNVLTLLAARGLGFPVVVAEHSDPILNRIGLVWGGLRRWTYRFATRVVVLNERARRFFDSRVGRRAVVIPNPVEVTPSSKLPASLPVRRAAAMGRLGEEKRFDILLEAFARVSPAHPDWRLIILGEGPLRSELEDLRDRLGLGDRVEIPGVMENPHAVLRGCDLFVLSSQMEGFPLALCEAMACGLPVIATEYHEGVRDIIRDGEDGVLIPPGDPGALAAAMDRLMSNESERRRLGARATEIRDRFSTEKVMRMWDSLVAAAAIEQ